MASHEFAIERSGVSLLTFALDAGQQTVRQHPESSMEVCPGGGDMLILRRQPAARAGPLLVVLDGDVVVIERRWETRFGLAHYPHEGGLLRALVESRRHGRWMPVADIHLRMAAAPRFQVLRTRLVGSLETGPRGALRCHEGLGLVELLEIWVFERCLEVACSMSFTSCNKLEVPGALRQQEFAGSARPPKSLLNNAFQPVRERVPFQRLNTSVTSQTHRPTLIDELQPISALLQ